MPTVSVVIPVYNARQVILDTIESVLIQTRKDFEIIVVDDGSTDGSDTVIRPFADRVRYIRQDNAGVTKARNRGIAESRGRYIALLDHDDLWHPTKLEKQVRLLEAHQRIGMVVTDVAHIDEAGRPLDIIGPGYNPAETFARLFVRGYVPTPSAVMIRRSVLDDVGGFDEAFHSAGLDDHELWTRIAAHAEIAGIPEPLTYHRNLSVKPAQVALDHRVLLVSKLMARFGDDPVKRRYLSRERAACLADQGKQWLMEGRRHAARSLFMQGLWLSLAEARSLKTGWRCLARLARSYVG